MTDDGLQTMPMTRYFCIPLRTIYTFGLLVSCLFFFFFWGCGKRATHLGTMPAAEEDRLYVEAEKLLNAGDYENALARYQAYTDQYPHRPLADDAVMKMASIHLANGRYREARNQYERVLERYPGSRFASDARVEILATFYHEGDFATLFERFESVRADELPRTARVRLYKMLGDAHQSFGRMKQAVDAYALSLLYRSEKERVEITPEMAAAIDRLDPRDIEELLGGADYLPKAYLMQRLQQKARYERFSIGCMLPMTGPYSSYGNRALRGVELAFHRFRLSNPEIPIRLVIEDTGGEEFQTVQAVRELGDARVAAIIGPILMAKPAAEEAQRMGIPIITLSQKDDIAGIGEYVFQNFLTPKTQVKTLVSYLVDNMGLKRFAILYPDEKYGATFMNLFWDSVIEHGGKVVGCEPYKGEETDFADPIKKLVGLYYEMPEDLKTELLDAARPLPEEVWRMLNPMFFFENEGDFFPLSAEEFSEGETPKISGFNIFNMPDELRDALTGEGDFVVKDEEAPESIVDFDALFIPDSPKKTGLIVPQLAYYDVEDVIFAGTNLWHSDELIQMARRYVQRSILTDGFFAESDSPLVREFVDTYTFIYGMQPGFIEAVAYDTAGILFGLIGRPDVMFRSTIREKLLEEMFSECVTGPTAFLETGEAEKQLYLLQIRGGRFRAVPLARREQPLP